MPKWIYINQGEVGTDELDTKAPFRASMWGEDFWDLSSFTRPEDVKAIQLSDDPGMPLGHLLLAFETAESRDHFVRQLLHLGAKAEPDRANEVESPAAPVTAG